MAPRYNKEGKQRGTVGLHDNRVFKQSVRRRHTETETEMETDGNKQAGRVGKIEPRRGNVLLLSEQARLNGAETNPAAAFITSSPVRAPPRVRPRRRLWTVADNRSRCREKETRGSNK